MQAREAGRLGRECQCAVARLEPALEEHGADFLVRDKLLAVVFANDEAWEWLLLLVESYGGAVVGEDETRFPLGGCSGS